MVSRTKAIAAALLLFAAAARAAVVAPANSLTIALSGSGIKAKTIVRHEGQPSDRIVPTVSNERGASSTLAFPTFVEMLTLDGGGAARADASGGNSGLTGNGVVGPAVTFSMDPKFVRTGKFDVVRFNSAAQRANSSLPFIEFANIGNDLVVPCTDEFTGTMTISQLEIEKLPARFHITKLNASMTGKCSPQGPSVKITLNADEPPLGGVITDAPATDPPIATADFPRTGTMTLSFTAEQGSNLGGLLPGKTYTFTQNDGPWTSYLRDPATESGLLADYTGAAPNHFEISQEPQGATKDKTKVFQISVKQFQREAVQIGSFDFNDTSGVPHFTLQINLLFCANGVTSSYTVDNYAYDCEFAPGGLPPVFGGETPTVHVVPHPKALTINFKMKCGDQKGGYHGTLTLKDDTGFDCGFPPATGTGGTGGGDTGSGGTGGGTGGTTPPPTTPSNAPGVSIPTDVSTDGIQLNNNQSVTVNLSTTTPSGFNGDVELAAFSEPEGLAVSLSKSAIPAPGVGTSVLTIAAGPNTRAGDYTVLISATGNGLTSFNVIKVRVLCDPPMILGLDQPRNVTINSGGNTTLEVKSIGSVPVIYQWYSGQSGATQNPIAGATGRTFTTPALNATSDYWVRVTNPCGSVDSNSATVTVH